MDIDGANSRLANGPRPPLDGRWLGCQTGRVRNRLLGPRLGDTRISFWFAQACINLTAVDAARSCSVGKLEMYRRCQAQRRQGAGFVTCAHISPNVSDLVA